MSKKEKARLLKMERDELYQFVLCPVMEGKVLGEEYRRLALDLLLEEAEAEAYREGKWAVARLF